MTDTPDTLTIDPPSVVLQRELDKPQPNWTRVALQEPMAVNNHVVLCRCQAAILDEYLVETGVVPEARDLGTGETLERLVAAWPTMGEPLIYDALGRFKIGTFGDDGSGFITTVGAEAISINDRHSVGGVAWDMYQQSLSRGEEPQMYHALQDLARQVLPMVIAFYQRFGL